MLKEFLKRTIVMAMGIGLAVSLPLGIYAAPKNLSKGIKKGDTVYFGEYEQDRNKDNGKEKIEWQVLDKKGNKALLISENILDVQQYHKKGGNITWEKCTLRKWLNKDFFKMAFSCNERKKIKNTKVINKDNNPGNWHTKGGKNTIDKVFLLSIDEAKKYFKNNSAGMAELTDYAIQLLAKEWDKTEEELKTNKFEESNSWYYWLRSPGYEQDEVASVDSDGVILESGDSAALDVSGCRPVLWVGL